MSRPKPVPPENRKLKEGEIPTSPNGVLEATPVQNKKQERLEELVTFLKNSSGFMLTVTTLNNGKLNHRLITQDFPEIDILKSVSAVEKLATERLKNL